MERVVRNLKSGVPRTLFITTIMSKVEPLGPNKAFGKIRRRPDSVEKKKPLLEEHADPRVLSFSTRDERRADERDEKGASRGWVTVHRRLSSRLASLIAD